MIMIKHTRMTTMMMEREAVSRKMLMTSKKDA